MPISFDTAAAERSDEARALFAKLASGTDEPIVLTTLSGVDLCILGAMSWEALATSWNRLRPEDRSKIIEARANEMIDRGLLIEQSAGQRYDPLGHYAVSAKVGVAAGGPAQSRLHRHVLGLAQAAPAHPVRGG